MRSKAEMIAELRRLLNEVFTAQQEGSNYVRLATSRGYADGYMRMLLDTGMCTNKELLEIVSRERERVRGPAMRDVSVESGASLLAT